MALLIRHVRDAGSLRPKAFDTGFEKGGQTHEHIMLVKTASVNKVVVVTDKMDDPTVNRNKARYEEFREKPVPFVHQAGFHIKDVTWLPVFYMGANLKDHLRKTKTWARRRRPVGNVKSGYISKGDTLLLLLNQDEIKIAAIYNRRGEVTVAISGDNVRIRLRGVEDDNISPGFVLTLGRFAPTPTSLLYAT
ncbi:hypothetical protein BC827DRAFT_1269849 [Russula dissimulans]|nr:hypothetical protein BC827DRAFT_1269849 [Russula dissimulans]